MPPHLPVPHPSPSGCWLLDRGIMDRGGRQLKVGVMISDALLGPTFKYTYPDGCKVALGACSFAVFVRDEY